MHIEVPTREQNIRYRHVWDIGPQELVSLLDKICIIDVRMSEETSEGIVSIPGSIAIPLHNLSSKAQDLPRDKPVVVVCRNGARSARAAALLIKMGFSEVYNLKGGILFWNEIFGASSN